MKDLRLKEDLQELLCWQDEQTRLRFGWQGMRQEMTKLENSIKELDEKINGRLDAFHDTENPNYPWMEKQPAPTPAAEPWLVKPDKGESEPMYLMEMEDGIIETGYWSDISKEWKTRLKGHIVKPMRVAKINP